MESEQSENMLPMQTELPANVRLRSTSIGYSSPIPIAVESLIIEAEARSAEGSLSGVPTTTTNIKMPNRYGSKEIVIIRDDELSTMAKQRFMSRLNTVSKNVREDREGTRIVVATPATSRKYVPLRPGRSLMDWIKLSNAATDLSGTDGKYLDISIDELKKHSRISDAWIALKGKVYNITPYLEYHPGGADILMGAAGKDATELFFQFHKWVNFEAMLLKCFVGRLVTLKAPMAKLEHREKELQKRRNQPPESRNATLVSKLRLNRNTDLFSFALDDGPRLAIPVAKHVALTLTDENDEAVTRSYTSVPKNLLESNFDSDERVHLAIKIYERGRFTRLLNKLEIGDPIKIGNFFGEFSPDRLKNIGCFVGIAAGSGITPMAAIVHHIYFQSEVTIDQVKLLHFVNDEQDLLYKGEFDALAQCKPNFSANCVVARPIGADWKGNVGQIDLELLERYIPSASEQQRLVCVCGPTDFNYKCASYLEELHVGDSEIFVFPNEQIGTGNLLTATS